MQLLSLLLPCLTGSPLWSKEINEAVEVQKGVSLVLQCRPPVGLPPPIIFWMDNSRSSAYKHICVLKQHITTQKPLHLSDFHKLPLDKRVSQALNGDLYFSNVLPEDSRPDYICYARFPHTQTIQQKQPISVTVLDSKSRR